MLDATNYAPQDGTLVDNTFPALLEKAVKESADPELWVLTANASLERSHVSAAMHRSVFGYMVSQGLSGAADRDHDRVIRLDELYNYVQSAVAAWVKMATASNESQTPQLLHFDPEKLSPDRLATERLVAVRKHTEATEHEQVAEHTDEPESKNEGGRGGISGWLIETGKAAKEELSVNEDIEVFQHMLGIHEGHEGAEHEGHVEHSEGPAEHEAKAGAEHEQAVAHSAETTAKSEAKVAAAATSLKQVRDAWQRVDKLEAASDQLSPNVVAPPLWRELLERLLWCDQFCAAGFPSDAKQWKQVAKELGDIQQSLADFAAYRLAPPASLSVGHPFSLALALRIAEVDPKKPLSKPLRDFLSTYDGLLLREPPDTFKDKLNTLLTEQKGDLGLANMYEFQLLELRKDADVTGNLLQLVLRARRVGERIAMNPLCGDGWSRAEIEAADGLRGEGERQLLDRTSSNWQKLASDRIGDALSRYEAAYRNLEYVRATTQLRNDMMLHAPDLIWRARLDGGDRQEIADLKKVFASLDTLNQALADPNRNSTDNLRHRRDQLEADRTALYRKTDTAESAWRMANVLTTALPIPELRFRLGANLAAIEQTQMSSFKLPDTQPAASQFSLPSDEQWKKAIDEIELRIALAGLAGYDEKSVGQFKKLLDGVSKQPLKLEEARSQLAELFEKLPTALSQDTEASRADRSAQPGHLRNAMASWLLLGPQHRDEIEPRNNLILKLDSASWHDLLAWNSERFRRAVDDAPVVEAPFLRDVSANFRSLANGFPDERAIPTSDPPALSIDSPSEVSLVASDNATLSFTVKSNASEEKPIWLIAQYNDKWLDIVGADVIHQQELTAALAASNTADNVSPFPLRPDVLGIPAKDRLPPGGARNYFIRIQRRPNADAGGAAKLILKAVSGDTFVRREIVVDLPGRESLDVTVNAPPEFWTLKDHALHPLPNRVQNFAFDVVNRTKVQKKLNVSIYTPSKVPNKGNFVSIPAGAQKAEAANKLLDAFGQLIPLGPVIPVDLPASGDSVRIKLAAGDPKLNPRTNLLLVDKAEPGESQGIPLKYGLIFLLTDRETNEVTIRRVQITPQRPRGYLDAVAHYDKDKEKLDIVVTAKNRDVIPSDGLQLSADVNVASAQLEQSLTGDIKAPNFATKLSTFLMPTGSRNVIARVNVDKYPRAFVFEFPRNTTLRDIAPSDLAKVRIVSPPSGTAFKAPLKSLTVTAEVDAPEGTFDDSDLTSMVEIGVDENEDRELQGEPVEIRRSDRQVTVTAKSLSPDGTLALETTVGDFHVDLSPRAANRRVYLLGRLLLHGEFQPSDRVEILLDGSPPIIHAAMPPNREVESDDDLIVHVITRQDEADLSGVRNVEAVFDAVATKDSKPAKWEQGVPDGNGGWNIKLSTKEMGRGPQTVLIRATDNVDNTSDPLRETITIVPKAIAPTTATENTSKDKQPELANAISGTVQFGEQAVKAKIALESVAGTQVPGVESDDAGHFKFAKVPPGKYTLKALTVEPIHGYFRKAEAEITVQPRPQNPTSATLIVR